jgi:hypothetical protein
MFLVSLAAEHFVRGVEAAVVEQQYSLAQKQLVQRAHLNVVPISFGIADIDFESNPWVLLA